MADLRRMRARFAAAVFAVGFAFLAGGHAAWADGPQAPMSPAEMQKAKGVTQQMPLGSSLNLELRKGYVFLSAADASVALQKLNVPPPSAPVLGAVQAEGATPGAKDYWISVITEDPVGHVPETGADEIASMSFLDTVKEARPPSPPLTAFAIAPGYTPTTTTLVWCEQYTSKPPAPGLRDEQRLLGRNSVAGVTTIGGVKTLKKIQANAKTVLSMISFVPGKTYADYVAGTDRASDYDLPGLITGRRRAGPLAETPAVQPAAAPAMSLADFAPGGKLQWVPWLGGGIVVLGLAFIGVTALRRRSSGVDYTAQDGDGDTA